MVTKLVEWGNSQGFRIPKNYTKDIGIGIGDEVEVTVEGKTLRIEKAHRKMSLEELISCYGPLNLSDEIDWGEPKGDEVW